MKAIVDWAIRHLTRQYELLDFEDTTSERKPSTPSLKLNSAPSASRH